MPRHRSPPRLYLDKARGQWLIRDGVRRTRTGLSELERVAAERKLADYLVATKTAEVPKRSSFVYFIECGDYIKIGYTTSMRARLASLGTATPYPIKVLGTVDGDKQTEYAIHTRFADAFHKGEWFRKTPEIMNFIAECAAPQAAAA